jgi:hypothetical protein
MRTLCLSILVLLLIATGGAQAAPLTPPPGAPILAELYPEATVGQVLIPRDQYHPFATAAERGFWESLPGDVRRSLIESGEKSLEGPWPDLPATLYLEFARNGNRSRYEGPYFERRSRLEDLVLAECAEGKGRFADQIVTGLWKIFEESSWCIPAHIGLQKAGSGLPDTEEPVVDLFSAETAGLLSWTLYLVGPRLDEVSPLVRPRLLREVERRVLTPCLNRDDFWWMGFGERERVNNWNPWINSNWLTAALLVEQDPARRQAAVSKILKSLDRFTAGYKADGGCDEGPSYWGVAGASLFDCLELLLSGTGGKIDVFSYPLIQNMGRYIYRVHICGPYFINFADAPAKVSLSGDLVYRYGKRIGDPDMMALGAWAAQEQTRRGRAGGGSMGRSLAGLVNLAEISAAKAFQPLVRDAWLDGIQVIAARSVGGSPDGLYLAAKGGNNAESHNHNDVGNFIVYMNGRPALVDAGVGTYTRQTFSSERYQIWTMQSAFHNLPTINGVMQKDGEQYAARNVRYRMDKGSAELSLDIAGAYPEEAGVSSWMRTVRLERGREVRVTENYRLKKLDGPLFLSLISVCEAKVEKPGVILLRERETQEKPFTLRLYYPADKLTATVEPIKLDDSRLQSAWGDSLFRIVLKAASGAPLGDTWNLRVAQ